MAPGTYEQGAGLPDYTINSYGLRGDEFTIPKPPHVFRILVLGSSTAFGTDVADDQTYPAALAQILEGKIPQKRVEVINYGMSGKSLYYNAKHYFQEAKDLDADVVILNNIRNTWFYDQNQEIFDYGDILLPRRYWITKVRLVFTDHLLSCRFLRMIWRHMVQKRDMVDISRNGEKKFYNRKFFETLYYDMIEGIYIEAKRGGSGAVIYILEPMVLDPSVQLAFHKLPKEELLARLHQPSFFSQTDIIFSSLLYHEIKRLERSQADLVVVDPVRRFIEEQYRNPEDPVFQDHVHLTARGNLLLAEMIADALLGTEKK
jgi:hypothetical protein